MLWYSENKIRSNKKENPVLALTGEVKRLESTDDELRPAGTLGSAPHHSEVENGRSWTFPNHDTSTSSMWLGRANTLYHYVITAPSALPSTIFLMKLWKIFWRLSRPELPVETRLLYTCSQMTLFRNTPKDGRRSSLKPYFPLLW